MGLDMYLRQSEYYSSYSFLTEEGKEKFNRLAECVKATPTAESPSITVDTTVAYWRKANAIHGWFVRELADGVDHCQEIEVSRGQLQSLVAQCKAVKATMDRVKEGYGKFVIPGENNPLPPTAGFFFGPTDDAEWYYEYIVDTIKKLETVLENTEPKPDAEPWDMTTFIYQASW